MASAGQACAARKISSDGATLSASAYDRYSPSSAKWSVAAAHAPAPMQAVRSTWSSHLLVIVHTIDERLVPERKLLDRYGQAHGRRSLQQRSPEDAELEPRQHLSDTGMDPETERQVMIHLTVDVEAARVGERAAVTVCCVEQN